jgi:hypothetical protein
MSVATMPVRIIGSAADRVLSRCVPGPGGCIIFTGALTSNGYGRIRDGGRMRLAHIVVYEAIVGPVPDGLQLDHVAARECTSKACVNPEHLEPVTGRENTRRAKPLGASGYRGVHRIHNRWRARIRFDGAMRHLGIFSDILVAAEVARQARVRLDIPWDDDSAPLTALTPDVQARADEKITVVARRLGLPAQCTADGCDQPTYTDTCRRHRAPVLKTTVTFTPETLFDLTGA